MTTVEHTGQVIGYLSGLLLGEHYAAKTLLDDGQCALTLYEVVNTDGTALTRYNVVYITFETGDIDLEKYKVFLATYAATLQLLTYRYYMVVDTYPVEMDDKRRLFGLVKMFTAVNTEMTPCHQARLLCTVVVISSPVVRVFINSVLALFYKPLRPLMFVAGFDEFRGFLEAQVAIDEEIFQGLHDGRDAQA